MILRIALRPRNGLAVFALLAALATARAEGAAVVDAPVAAPPVAETPVAESGLLERLSTGLLPYLPWRLAAHKAKPADNKSAEDKPEPVPVAETSKTAEAPALKDTSVGGATAWLMQFLPWGKHGLTTAVAPPVADKPPAVEEQSHAPPEKVEAEKPEAPAPVAAAAPAASGEERQDPAQLIRHLQDVQEKVAAGDRAAFVEQPRLMKSLTQKFASAPQDVWGKVENARALILYLLSGGSPTLGRKILATHGFAPAEEPLAKGALAYLEDRPGADQEALLALDPRAQDLNLGGHVAFIQSILLTTVDRGRAIERLDEARLLMPGSLVEEAALRREVALLAETQNFDKFAALARQYWTRFRASPYADNFLRQFTLAAARVSLSIKSDQWTRLDELLENLPPDARRAIYLNMAHAAVVSGNVALAAAAARRGQPLFAEGSLDRQRAQLYIATAQVATPDVAQAEAALGRLDRSKLSNGDALLAQATMLVAAQMRRPPQQGFTAEPPGEPSRVDETMARAETGLRAADEAMASIRKTLERKTP